MSQQRVRYIKEHDGSYRSGQYIKSETGVEFVCGYSNDGLSGYVVSVGIDDPITVKVKGTSSHKTKMAIKKALEALGVVFIKESRESRSE